MSTQILDGKRYAQMLLGGAALLSAHAEELNALNVFPVCDGDTGTNMSKTMQGGLAELDDGQSAIGRLSNLFAKGILLSARGNSGVILSQIFAGINEKLKEYETVNAIELADAYRNGIAKSYAAVQNPTEGTILTVFRESTEYARARIDESSTVEDFFRLHIDEARRCLQKTKELLPVLAEADVVDSGAAGYLFIAEGMYEALSGKKIEYQPQPQQEARLDIDAFTRDSVLEFGYCTEVLIRLTTAKVDPDTFALDTVLQALQALQGESVVAYKQDDIVKVHVHTFTPGAVLAALQNYGEFLTVKIENMSLGHSESERPKPEKKKPFSVVAVAAGEGIAALFTDMGADQIIEGGQSFNPSAEDFVKAFRHCNSEHIIVLPNNKNVVMAAKQAAELYEEAEIHVIETKNIMQGFGALSVITPGIDDVAAQISGATRAAADVIDCEVTAAVRDAHVGGFDIKAGDFMAISGGHIVAVKPTAEEALLEMLAGADADLCEIITVFVGKAVTEERRAALAEALEETYGDCEISFYEGGQEIYDYYLALE
ncbi:MAG: DAK2 domain-containing protein [Ruminococcaceae bacterium]|nr:DAK2 domain-containing protein [Oscillospiraceae bacterium]